jgi:hypothetical protein
MNLNIIVKKTFSFLNISKALHQDREDGSERLALMEKFDQLLHVACGPQEAAEIQEKQCSKCNKTKSPQWRHGPPSHPLLCNACGSYWMRHGRWNSNPRFKITIDRQCCNCETTRSRVWRRGPPSHPIMCNACSMYWRRYNKLKTEFDKTDKMWRPN